jgi:hypothetical protein
VPQIIDRYIGGLRAGLEDQVNIAREEQERGFYAHEQRLESMEQSISILKTDTRYMKKEQVSLPNIIVNGLRM